MLKPLKKELGVNSSEKKLASQSVKIFFSLWSHPNLYRDEGKGKEVVDLLVYFNNQIILFSDKGEVKFQSDKELKLGWSRWYRAAVKESAKQLYGAESFIRRSKNHIFCDKKCQEVFPFDLSSPNIKIHLVCITRGISNHAKAYFDSFGVGSSGTLIHDYTLNDEKNIEAPFTLSDINKKKAFVHVIDEVGLELLLTELDTPSDFLHYLNTKETAIRKGKLLGASGEEEVLAFYLQEIDKNGYGSLSVDIKDFDGWHIPENEWFHYIQSESYQYRLLLKQQGIGWKNWVAKFSDEIISANVGEFFDQPILTHANALERIASENLVSRAFMAQYFFEKYFEVPTRMRSARALGSICNPNRIYIFLFFPWLDTYNTQEDYRKERFACMQLYGWVARLKFPQKKEIIVIGSTTNGMKGSSETILAIDSSPPISDLEKRNIIKVMKEHSIFYDVKPRNSKKNRAHAPPIQKSIKLGRNDQCPCTSGKKYKNCCINNAK